MSALDAQVGYGKETTWGTAVTPSRFGEFNSEGITATYGRVESDGLRPGRYHRSDTRFTTYVEGAAGDLTFEVGSKGFGFWLEHMVGGTVVTSGPTDSAYTHTAAGGSLTGKGFTLQVGRPFYDGSSVQPFTYNGGKVTSWELSTSVEGNVMCTLSCDFQNEVTATALATASYPASIETLAWVGTTVTIGGVEFHASEITVGQDNSLKTDRRYLRGSTLKKEQIGDDYRATTFSMTADFDSLTQQARVASVTAAGAIASIVTTFEGKGLIGATAKPQLVVTVNGRFDEFTANVDGPTAITQSLSGQGLGATAVALAYKTLDTTP